MSDRLTDAFDIRGRLSLAQQLRLERKLLLVGLPGVLGPIFLLMVGVPRLWAATPALILAPVLFVSLASNVRRLHDVGEHAWQVYSRRIAASMVMLAPLAIAVGVNGLPMGLRWGLVALSGAGVLVGLVTGSLRRLEWRRGDAGSNAFGPPPASSPAKAPLCRRARLG